MRRRGGGTQRRASTQRRTTGARWFARWRARRRAAQVRLAVCRALLESRSLALARGTCEGCCAWEPDTVAVCAGGGGVVALGCSDNVLRLWDVRTRATQEALSVKSCPSHAGWVVGLAWQPGSEHVLASASHDHTVKVRTHVAGRLRVAGPVTGARSLVASHHHGGGCVLRVAAVVGHAQHRAARHAGQPHGQGAVRGLGVAERAVQRGRGLQAAQLLLYCMMMMQCACASWLQHLTPRAFVHRSSQGFGHPCGGSAHSHIGVAVGRHR